VGCNLSDSVCLTPSRVAQPSHGQRSLWFLHHLAPEAGAYNIAAAARLRSPVDAGALERAFQALVDRHGALRTTFPATAGEPCRRVAEHLTFTLGREDATGWSDERLRSRLADEAWRPFDLENGPLLRVTLVTGAPGGPVLLVVIHHIVADFWSLALVMREVPALYREEDLASPGLSYDEHVRLEREALSDGRGAPVLDWWRERLAGLPMLELPTDRPRPAVQTYRGDTHRLRLPGELAAALRARSREQHGTLFMTLAAAFQALLGRLSGQEDLAIGTARSGRTHAQVAGTVGYFVNHVVLRGDLTGDPAFVELLERTKAMVQAAFAHGDYPLPLLAEHLQPERDASRTPLFQVSLVLQKETRGAEGLTAFALGEEGVEVGPQGFRLESMSLPQPPSPFDLVLHCVERQGGLSLALQYNADLFDATTTELLLERFERLLAGVAADPRQRLSELPLLSAAEREQLLVEWNDTAAAPQQPAPLVHELVAEQARRRPEALAVATPEARITYGELASRARQLAATLGRLGVRPEVRVALCAGHAVERVVGSLAVLTAGGAYVLLDPESPPERLAFLVTDSRAEVVLTERALAGRFESCGARLVELSEAIGRGDGGTFPPFPSSAVRPDNLAYVVYTSGSTGLPKGVAVSHAGLLNLVRWHGATYGAGADDRATLIANPAFDASVWELWPYLASGASVHVPDAETRLAPPEIVRFWRSEGITWSFLPTPLAEEVLVEGDLDGLSLKGLLCGGDRLHHVLRPDLPFSLINHYGPSEVSVVSTSAAVVPGTPGLPPIGRPIHNLRTRVVDAWGALAPRGAVGELWIGGVGLARGYLDRPALTAERFVPDPWNGAAGERLYRSGDRVRLRPDGSLEFLGRIDHQIKLRGFRIEPGEIEAALRAYPGVSEAAVAMHQGRLAAYVVLHPADRSDLRSALRDHLRERLPAYMVPAAFVALAALPLTPNGKLDRKALPEPGWEGTEAAGSQMPPRTPAEELMAGIFAEVLGIDRIGVEDSFFEHGGHSLAALRLSARIREAFGVELPVHRVFETPTVAALAAEIAGTARSGAPLLPPLVPVPRDQPLPLSFAQQRLWFLHQLEPASPAYNVPAVIRLDGPLDGAVLAASLEELARRHETLRTRFVAEPGGPVQVVDPPAPIPLPEIDLTDLPADEARRLARAEALRPFDLTRGPLLRAALARLGGKEHLLLLTLHHIVSDGWSLRVLARELGDIYGAFAQGRPSPLPELEIQYGDYAVWQRSWLQGGALEAELAHWRKRLTGAPPVLDLPLDRPRPAAMSDRGGSRALMLPAALMPPLQALARRQGVTLFMATLAAFQALLARVSTSEDVSVGTPVAGRRQIRTEGLIGFFVNTLVMRTDLSGEPPFTELLARVREVALAAYTHQDLPFEKLVEELHPQRDLGIAPLFQVSFVLDGEPLPSLRLGEVAGDAWRLEQETEKFDLSLTLGMEAEGLSGGLSGGMGFRADLFDGATVERLAGSFVRLLAGAVEEPRRRLSELPLLSLEERAQLLVEWNDTATASRSEPLVHELVAAWARRRPEGLAVAAPGERLGYGELVARAGGLARILVRLGVGPEVRVTLCAGPTVHRVVGSLAVLLAGGAYVPVDTEAPPERLTFLVADSGSQVVLTERALAGRFAGCAARIVPLEEAGEEASFVPARAVGPDNLAYVVYTSGSTGRPKGVAVSHAGLLNLVRWHEAGYGVGPDDRATLIANPAFDAAVWEIWPYLAAGASLHIPGVETRLAPAAIVRFWREQGITWSFLPTPLAQEVIADPAAVAGLALRGLLCGGDRLHRAPDPDLGFRLINHYGPSEVSVVSTSAAVPPETAGVPSIGRPIDNTRTFVADARGGLAPRGSAGELWIGGAGLARGYLDRPALTAERFVPDPWSGAAGERLYRTGDLVRHRPDGAFDFLGRIDHQIKLRGFRIEPGEIEALLCGHPAVSEAAVAVLAPARLVAYVVGRDGLAPSAAELRGYLRERLPGYMVPAAYVVLPSLPLTPSGKLDRKALPDPGTEERDGILAPRTATEELVARIFAEVLKVEQVGRDEDFFELGGHSLLVTQVVSRVRAACGVELPVRAVFEAPTVERLAAWLDSSAPAGDPSRMPARAPSLRQEPLSFAQQRLWFLDQLEPGSPLYNIAVAVELRGGFDPATLAAALGGVVRRHEALRTTFQIVAGEPVQVVSEPAGFDLPRIDLAALPERAREEEAGRLAVAEARRPFDLGQDAPLRAALLRPEAERHVLLLTMHHIVSDGWSMGVLVRELGALYAAFLDGRPSPLPELALQYADFAAWQRRHLSGERLEAELAWWSGQLAGMPPVLELPADHPRPGGRSAPGAVHDFRIEPELLAGITALSRRHGTTLFMTLLAGFVALLERWTGQDDLAIGTPIAGRTQVETEPLIGLFVNTLVLRANLAGDPGFVDLLARVREATLSAYAHQEVPFERLVEELAPERTLNHPPLVQVLFALQNAPLGSLELPGLALTASCISTGTARLELSCLLTETARGLDGTVEYRRDLFEEATIVRLVEHLARLLAGAVEDPRRRMSELPLLSDMERTQLLVEWSGKQTAYPREATIHGLFAEQAALRPNAMAVVGTGESLTYGELRRRAGALARQLRRMGVGTEGRVGVCLERSPERVVATLAVLEAGGVYVPLDPAYPQERLEFLLADAGVRVVLVHEPTRARMEAPGCQLVEVKDGKDFKDSNVTGSSLESLGGAALAYVMYTSGSTGEPKGVAVPHRAVVRLVRETGYARFGPDEVFLQLAPYSFDASTLELWGALLNGGRLVLPPPGVLSPAELGELLSHHRVTTLWLTAGLFHQMVEENLPGLAGVRQLLAGGDVLSVPHVRRVLEELPGTRLINGYGPTENTTFTCCYPVPAVAGPGELETSVPLGRPIANTRVVVLDRHLEPVPVGVAGELCTGGDGLARGYLGRPDRTAERFVPDPFGREAGGRLYRTGDLARWQPAGTLEFLGRIDTQVKVRGFRVEPGEIEAALLEHPWAREAVVLAERESSGSQRLVAYVVLHQTDPSDSSDRSDPKPVLAASLRWRLPEFMLPAAWVFLPSLPLTANGKVDRQALAKRRPERPAARAAGTGPAPWTPAEELVARIFAEVLELEQVGRDENFFELGGHSLLATRISSRMRAVCGLELPVRMVFEAPTVEGLAAWIERSTGDAAGERIARVPREEPLVLSFAQQRLWFLDQLEPGSIVYNIPAAVELTGRLDAGAMAAAFGEVVRRHEVLRTTFREVAGEPVQVVAEPAGFALPLIDLESLPALEREREAGRLAAAEARRPFDLEAGPLLRAALLRSAAGRHTLVLTMHHIVSDGWSMSVLVRELGALYAAQVDLEPAAGRPSPLPELAIQYADFAAWQRRHLPGAVVETELAWWLGQLAGIPPALEMPVDHPRPAVSSLRGAVHRLTVAAEDLAGLNHLSQQHGATLFMTLLAGFAALLHRASGQEDVVVGTPIAGRTRIETEPLIGFFVNTLALRADLSGAPGFLDLLARVRETTLAAYAHQELPFERLVEELAPERDRSRTPIFQAMLAFQNNALEALALPGIEAEVHTLTTGTAKFDLNLVLSETAQGGLTGLIEFSLDLFDGTTIARLAGHFARLLAAAAADPFQPVRELPLLADGERHQLLAEWNDTRAPFPETMLLHQFFETAVERAPEAIAAACAGRELSYAELDARSNRLAHLLRNAGVDRGAPVGVWVERSLDMPTAVLGVLKAGGHYVALDEAWPADRVESILAATGAPAIVAGTGLLGAVEEMRWRLPALSDAVCLAFAGPEPPAEEIDPESVRALWDFVAERAVDRVTAGGFVSAFTGQPMSEAEVDEYRDRVLSLAGPWLHPEARVLEIGNGSGLLLWEMASRAAHVTGVDPSPLTQERNKEHAAQEGIANVELLTGFAHEVDGLLGAAERFDLILLASTVQFFPGPRYLERMVRQALGRLAPGGALLIADVLDARRREELRQVTDEHRSGRGLEPAAPRRELFLDEDFFRDLGGAVHHRTAGFPNELGFRYDVLLTGEPAERRKRVWTGWHVDRCLSTRPPQVAAPEDVAYVIHTSGSTGEPKGIVVQHRPADNLVDWVNRTFEVGPADRGLFVTSLCFDLSVWDIFGMLAAGGTVHVATRDELTDPDHLVRLLRTGGITVWDSAPAALLQLAPLFPAEPDSGSRLRRVLLSGDWIPVTLPDRVRQSFPGTRVMALGGATEATVWSNWFPVGVVDPAWPSIPYGRPMANARYHVLDAGFAPCPIGVPGDLYIGGDCLCAGYARRPELTAQAFLPDPFSGFPSARLYRTGDRARAFADGNLEFLGRLDQQVKVRGYRIELGEIEVALARHPGVREAVAMAREDEPGDKRLVAYVVLADGVELEPEELRDSLRRSLPEYMIPSAFVTLPELPVTANGKLDRRALPAPQYSASAGFVAAQTSTEEALAAIWSSILSVPQVGREDGFFDLGGHSLLATQMLSRVREAFGVELSLRTLFDKPRLADLAETVDTARTAGELSMDPRLRPMARVELMAGQGLPLSFAQQRLWFLEQLEPGSPAYNIPMAIRLDGRLDPAALAAAFGEVVRRHEVLRTKVRVVGGEPVLDLTPDSSCPLPLVDLEGFEAEVGRVAFEEARRPFDLGAGPLLRVLLLRLGVERHTALVTMHHIVSDGWSMGVLVRELWTLYDAQVNREPAADRPSPLPELPIQYAEYAAWQRQRLSGELLEAELAWWRERLAGMPQVLDLPTDHPRPAKRGLRGAVHRFTIDGEGLAGLTELSRRHGATLFMTLLAGFAALLHRATSADDLAVGTPIAGRTRAETEALIGLFVNTLVLRTGLAGDPEMSGLLDQVRETTLSAYAHQEVPFERLVEELAPERDLSRPPLVQVLLVLHNAPSVPQELPGLALTVTALETGTAKLDLACAFIETEQGLAGTFEYSPDLFEAATIERWAGHLTRLLAGAAADPHQRLSELPMLSVEERRQLLVEWNSVGTFTDSTLQGLFEAQAAVTPEAMALVDGRTGERWTYSELNEWAGTLAHELIGFGVGPEVRVAVQLPRTPHLVASLLAVLKAGGAYVPLDPTYPEDRLAFLLEDSQAAVLITEEAPSTVETPRGASPPRGVTVAPRGGLGKIGAAAGDAPRGVSTVGGTSLGQASHPGNLAYLIYTSGSTGRPKAVAIEHRSAVAFAHWARTVFSPEDFAGVLAATSISFDLSVFEIFVTLAWGGKVILAGNALEVPNLAAAGEVTLINTVPSAMTELVRQRAVPPSVRTINLAGEPLKRSLVDAIYATTAATQVLDLYGPSESTTYSTWAPALRGERREPTIGQPVAGTRALLLGRHGELLPVGIAGEIFLGGAGLARGYLNRPDLTAERFVPDPFHPEPGSRLYRTGDLARRLPDGLLDYLGRVDQQVKVRGFRIEPGEIEAALLAHSQVQAAAVALREDEPGDKRLVAYVVPAAGQAPAVSDLRDVLRRSLPEHMIPGAFVILQALPLTPNGKLDRRALPAPDHTPGAVYAPPRTPVEETLAAIWSDMLRVPQVGREDRFFDLGGHSLLATQMISRVQEACGAELPLRAVFEAPKLADLARAVEAAQAAGTASVPRKLRPLARREPIDQPIDQQALPLSFAQQRLWLLQQLEPGSATYNIPVAVELSGRLDVRAMASAVAEVVRRHESLRTTFTVVDGAPLQVISPPGRVDLPLVDLAAVPAPAADAEAERLGKEQAGQGFDLERGPLVAGLLARLPGERHHFLLTLHHIISDGWSIGVLIHELGALYAAFVEGRPSPLPELPIQYADFAVWQREQLAEKQAAELAYWETRLGGEVATVELPTDRPRPAVQTFRGGRRQLALSPELTARLKSFGRGEGSTLFMTLLTATQALLSRHSGEQDVPVGAPVAGRQHSATEGLIGCFLNTLVLRTDLSGAPSFRELVARVRTVTLEAYSNQDVPFEAVLARLRLDRDLSRSPLFQVLFNLLNLPARDLSLPGLGLRVLTLAEVPSKLDMTFYVSEAESRIWIDLVYNADLFDEARMADVLAQLEGLLAQAMERPDEPVDHLSLVTAAARALLPDPAAVLPVPDFPPVARLFLDREREQPEQPALAWSEGAWTYAQLGARAREIARAAVAAGAGPGTVVAVAGSRSPELIAGLLGVFLSGGVLLILDRNLPAARLRVMVEEAKPGCLIYVGEPRPEEDTWLWEERSLPVLAVQPGPADGPDIGPDAPAAAFPSAGPDDPAYVFFTSGTTGRPKAVLGRQKGLSHFLTWQRSTFGIGPGDRAAQLTGLSFDVVLRDVFLPLTSGATLVLPDEDDVSPERILLWLRERAISVVHTVPSLASAWLGVATPGFKAEALRWTFFAGEPLLAQVVTRWRAAFPETSVVNLYGPTETTLAKCFYRVPDPPVQDVQPVGTPLPQAQALILGGGERLCGLGEVGEIVVRTPFRSLGYLNNPEENRRFRPNPFRSDSDDLLYVSGDRGRYRLDGTVEILGRLDEQVKVRGVRVEPAEIRAALGRHPAVWESAVLVRENRPGSLSGDKRLVAYLVLRPGAVLDLEALRRHLRQELPEAMVPSTFVTVDALPLTPNGKLDRRTLLARSEPEIQVGGDEPRALRTPVEEIVAGVCAEVLGLPQVGPDGNFFQLGGHSLSGAQLVSRLRQALQVDLPLRVLFEAPTVAGLAAEIERRRRDGAPERPAISAFRQDRSAPAPLSFAQERFWAERQLESRTVASTLPTLVLLEGPLDVDCLRRAVQEIVDRHEVLRTTFRDDLDRPVQIVHTELPVHLPVIDLQEIARPVQRAEIQRWSTADGRSPFDYERGPLFRMTLFRCSEREHAVLFTIHHVAFDGWSRSVLVGELAVLYNAFREGRPSPLRPLAAQYQDFARWQRQVLQRETLEREVGFWREHLSGASPVRLGRDLPRHPTYAAGLEAFTVPEDLERKLDTFAAENCVTLFMTLLAAFKALLHLESGRDDIVVTSLFANRNQLETEGLIGNFFAGLPLRTRLDGVRTFRTLLERVRDVTLAAHEHPDILYEQAMEGASFLAPGERGGIATFRIMFQLAKLPRAHEILSDLKLVHVPFDTGKIRQDLTLFFTQADRLGGRFKYNRDVLDEETVVRLRDRFLRILETIVSDPDRPLDELLVEDPAVLEGTL